MTIMRLHWGWRIAIVYTLFAIGTLSFVGFALTNEVDLVRGDYYEQGLRHDAHALAEARAEALVPAPTVVLNDVDRNMRILMPVTMVGTRVSVEMYCPSQLHQDKVFDVLIDGAGSAVISLEGYSPAPWIMTASWIHAGSTYRVKHAFTVRSGR